MLNKKEHLFICLAEECAEVQKATTKTLRFGPEDAHPVTGITNHDLLVHELADLLAVLSLLEEEKAIKMLSDARMETLIETKKQKVKKYMKYAQAARALNPNETI